MNPQKVRKSLWLAIGVWGLPFLGCGPGEVGAGLNQVGVYQMGSRLSFPGHPIMRGMKGPEVEWIQERLSLWGHFIRPEGRDFNPHEHITELDQNQSFGPLTEIAVSSFQAWNRVWRDQDNTYFSQHTGVVDEATWNALARDPELTSTNKPTLPGGVALGKLSREQFIKYLMQQYEKYKVENIPFNRDPGGVNFIQIRGFDYQDWVAIQNTHDEFNDPIFVLVNPDDCEAGSCVPAPDRLVVLRASADYGWMFTELAGFGFWRPAWMTQELHPVLGPRRAGITPDDHTSECKLCVGFDSLGRCYGYSKQCYESKGLNMTAANRVMFLQFGTHQSGLTNVYRGIALRDPDDRIGAVHAYVDFNHNHQVDGLEQDYEIGIKNQVGNNLHHAGNDTEHVAAWSAGCHTMAMDGSYQKFTKIVVESSQVAAYIKKRNLAFADIRGWRCNQVAYDKCVKYQNSYVSYIDDRTDDYQDGKYIFAGQRGSVFDIRFPFALLDSRDLDPLTLDDTQGSCMAQKGEPCCQGGGCAKGLACMSGTCFGPEGIAPWYACDPASSEFKCQNFSSCCECERYGFYQCDPQNACSDPVLGMYCKQICANICSY